MSAMRTAISDAQDYRSADNDTADAFVDGLHLWFSDGDEVGPMGWHHVGSLSDEYADYIEVKPITSMALAKALSRRGIKSNIRYLQPGQFRFASAQRKGSRCPFLVERLPGTRPVGRSPQPNQWSLRYNPFGPTSISFAQPVDKSNTQSETSIQEFLLFSKRLWKFNSLVERSVSRHILNKSLHAMPSQ